MTEPIPEAREFDQDLGGDLAYWLIARLPNDSIQTDPKPCQEDWGWEVFVSHPGGRFWIGVSPLFDASEPGAPPTWIAHIHRWGWNIALRFTRRGRRALADVAIAVDTLLRSTAEIDDVRWHYESDVIQNQMDKWSPRPDAA